MNERLADWVVDHPWWVIGAFALATAVFAWQIPRATIDPEVKNQLAPDMPTRLALDRIEALFGGSELVILSISAAQGQPDVLSRDTLTRIKAISKAMEREKGFDKVLSIFTLKDIRGEEGAMIVDPAVDRIPRNEAQRQALKARLADNDLVYGAAISKDFQHAAVIGMLGFGLPDEAALARARAILEAHPGPEPTAVAGMPFVRVHIAKDIPGDMRRFMPLGLGLMLVFLLVAFRQARGVLLPFAVTIMSIVVAMGLIPLLGWKISMITVILPVILLAVANDYGIHLYARYQEMNTGGRSWSSRELARDGILHLSAPVLATALTTAAGLLCLLTHIIVPARQMGVLAALGVGVALLGSLLFMPAVLAVLSLARPLVTHGRQAGARAAPLDRILAATARAVTRHPRAILAVGAALVALVALAIPRVVVDTNPVNYYPADAPVPRAMNLVNDHFGGASGLSVVAEGDIKEPSVMRALDDLETHLRAHPKVDVTSSIARVVKRMHKVMNDGAPAFERVPDSRDAVAQYFELYAASGDPDDFDRLVDFPCRHAQLMARVNDSSTSASQDVVDYLDAWLQERPGHPFTTIGGFAHLFADLVGHVVRGQVTSLLLSLLVVGLLVGLLFRSFVAALLSALPLVLSLILLFGIMGASGVELNLSTAMLSSIMIGVGVDYTIHFLWRYRQERREGLAPPDAVVRTLTTSGRGIVFNALSVIVGFAVLTISAFLPVRFFGVLVVTSISTCLVAALVVLPALALVIRPRFLEPAAPATMITPPEGGTS